MFNPWNSLNTVQKHLVEILIAFQGDTSLTQEFVADILSETLRKPLRTSSVREELVLLRRMRVISWDKGDFATIKVLVKKPSLYVVNG